MTNVGEKRTRWFLGFGIALCVALISACGGGGGGGGGSGGSPPPTSPSNAPTITTNPQSTSVAAGAAAAFNVAATGSTPLSYQWQRNGSDIAGATGASYSTPPTSSSDNGAVFRVVISNTAGSATSNEATLTISPLAATGEYFLLGEAGLPVSASTLAFFDGSVPAKRYPLVGVSADGLRAPVTIEPGGTWAEVLDAYFVEGKLSGDQWTTYRTRYRAYVKGGRFHILDQETTLPKTTPELRPWTTLTPAQTCRNGILANGMTSVDDTVDGSKSYLFLREPGADRSCGTPDDVIRALRVSMSANDAALIVDEPVAAIRAVSEAVTGFLTRAGTQIRRVDENFANTVTTFALQNAATPSPSFVDGSSAPGIWFFVDGPGIYAYRLDGSASPTLIETLAAGERVAAVQSSRGESYWVITGPGQTRIIGVDQAFTVSAIGTLPEAPSGGPWISSHHLVFKTGNVIRSVPRQGGSAAALIVGDATWTLGSPWLSGDAVYVTATSPAPIRTQVRIIGSDGSNAQTIDNAQTFIPLPKNPLPRVFAADRLNALFDTVVLVQGISSAPYLSGAELRAYDGASRSPRLNYGAFPSAPSNLSASLTGSHVVQFGHPGLLQLQESGRYGSSALDLIYFNSGSAGLTRLTSNLP